MILYVGICMHCMHMSQKAILAKYSFAPEDFILYEIDHLRANVSNVSKEKNEHTQTDKIVFQCAKTALRDLSRKNTNLVDFEQGHTVLILNAARLADALTNVEPSISSLKELTGIDRNLIAVCSKVLEDLGLVRIKHVRREERIFPTELALLYLDTVLLNGRQSFNKMKEVAQELTDKNNKEYVIRSLQLFESAFDMAERKYPSNSLNYQILDKIHKLIMDVLVDIRHDKSESEILPKIKEITQSLEYMSKARERAKELSLSPVLVRQTGEEIGGHRVYQVE
jgi:hypothetical protein